MSREIKFRVWDKTRNEMNYSGNLGAGSSADLITICFNGSLNIQNAYGLDFGMRNPTFDPPVDNFELMQFTGLQDKNGVDIYEGDIINSFQNDYSPTEVYYDNELAQFSTQNYHSTLSLHNSINSEVTVLGNIHENPELFNR